MHQNQPIPIDEQFKIMADTAPVLIWIAGVDKRCYFFNEGWLKFTGRTMEQEQGDGWAQGVHPDDLERCIGTYTTSFDAREGFRMEYRLRRHDGEYRWVTDHGVPRYAADGSFAGYIGSCMDIDEILDSERVKRSYINTESVKKEQELNEELSAANEELLSTNDELQQTQQKLAELNSDLERKVILRTSELSESEANYQALNEELGAINEELVTTNEELMQSQETLEKTIEELATTEQKVRSIVESAPFPIGVYVGREMRIELANQSIIDVWGKGEQVIGKTYSELLPELENTGIYDQLDAVFTTGIPFHARNQRVDIVVDGILQPFYFNYSFTPLYTATGEIYGVMNTAAEITDLVVAKQQAEQSRKNLYSMILQAPVAMCILLGPKHVVEVANQLMIKLWGKADAEVWGKPIFEGLPDARDQGLEELLDSVYHTGTTVQANERPVELLRSGKMETVYQNFVYEPYKDANGKILGVIAITIDVTAQVLSRKELERSEAELLETKRRLEAELEAGKKLQQQKDSFIGIASHELKTPLTSLTAIVQVLSAKLKNTQDAFIATGLEKANFQVKKMSNLINGFLNISRLESGKIHIDKEPFELNELIKELVSEIGLTAPGHTIHFEEEGELNILADREKIGSVLSNLMSNAVKYSPKGKNIYVYSRISGKDVLVSIRDEGMGVKEKDLDKLFDRYYRVESDHTKHISGFGIGLYLSAEIIRQHNGRIWAESKSGVGSTFHFTLPLS